MLVGMFKGYIIYSLIKYFNSFIMFFIVFPIIKILTEYMIRLFNKDNFYK